MRKESFLVALSIAFQQRFLLFRIFAFASVIGGHAIAASFTPLGYLPGGYAFSEANDVSADGRVVVGQAQHGGVGNEAFRWTANGGMQGISDFPTGDFWSTANAVSDDGNVIVGRGTVGGYSGVDGFRWTQATGVQPLGYLIDDPSEFRFSYGLGVSGDGSIAVGGSKSPSGNEAFQWTQEGGIVGLGDLDGGSFESTAYAISSDGSVIVGDSRSADALEAFRWTQEDGVQGLGFLPEHVVESHAWSISADGSTIIGSSSTQGWRWTEETGMIPLPHLSEDLQFIIPADVSGDGSIIVGRTSISTSPVDSSPAFIWTSEFGTVSLQEFVSHSYGLSLDGWILNRANGISDDGKVIVGRGVNPSGHSEAWVIYLVPEPSCRLLVIIGALTVVLWRVGLRAHLNCV